VALAGEKPKFDFEPLPHWDLGKMWDLLDFEKGAEVASAGYYYTKVGRREEGGERREEGRKGRGGMKPNSLRTRPSSSKWRSSPGPPKNYPQNLNSLRS
jgi:hypothetical protein